MFKTVLLCCLLAAVVFAAPKVPTLNNYVSKYLRLGSQQLGLKRIAEIEKQLQGLEKAIQAKATATQLAATWKPVVSALARQVSLQQLYVQEMTRTSGYSGLKNIRLGTRGTRPYHYETFTKGSPCSMHNHNNLKYTIGLGELVAVLNGVLFRTRHNDYKMYMPHRTLTTYGKTEPIPYPDVPPEVLNKTTIDEQILEMREWFKAWKNQDSSKRDYRKYFKPVLCYLEGMWTQANGNKIDEPFASDRHAIDAKSFFDLQDKIKYTTSTGRKSNKENYAYLPTAIAKMDDQGMPVYAQWNYKILCHPLKRDVPLNRLKIEDDLAVRVGRSQKLGAVNSRATRFSLWQNPPKRGKFEDGVSKFSQKNFLDQLMSEIPGKDNYGGKIVDSVFGETAYRPEARPPPFVNGSRDWSRVEAPLNVAYYHSQYKVMSRDAMGLNNRLRGFNDGHLYVAYNTQPKISAFKVEKCKGAGKSRKCIETESRVSYAIPLELIYLTPLNIWNPYDIPMMPSNEDYRKCGANCTRNGGSTPEAAYLGSTLKSYYFTPAAFFSAKASGQRDKADTTKARAIGVLDKNGVVRMTRASGIPIVQQSIPDVGVMRMRYPIMPLHIDGDHAYKTVEALADMSLHPKRFAPLYPEGTFSLSVNGTGGFLDPVYEFETTRSTSKSTSPHTHTFELALSDLRTLKTGKRVKVVTSTNAGHDHELVVRYSSSRNGQVLITACDGKTFDRRTKRCWDGHISTVYCTECRDSLKTLTSL